MKLSIIIVNWNSRDYLRECLASIVANTEGITYEVVVIDSASFDQSDVMIRQNYPFVRFIQSPTNLGFARANNVAFGESTGEYVLFLNPDTEVASGALGRMLEQLENAPDAGVLGCRLLNTDGSVQTSCIQAFPTVLNQLLDAEVLRKRWPKSSLWGIAPLYSDTSDRQEVEAVSGACLMIKRTVFERVERFSEEYFMYAEDIDLAYKVRQAGYRNYYVPDASVIHHGGSSSQQANESRFSIVMTREANRRFLHKTHGAAYAVGYRAAMGISAIARLSMLAALGALDRKGTRWPESQRALQKWRAVLQWSITEDVLIAKYYGSAN